MLFACVNTYDVLYNTLTLDNSQTSDILWKIELQYSNLLEESDLYAKHYNIGR